MVGELGFSLAGLFMTYTHVLYESQKDPELRMYVSMGINSIIAPIRLFCKPEILEVTLTRVLGIFFAVVKCCPFWIDLSMAFAPRLYK